MPDAPLDEVLDHLGAPLVSVLLLDPRQQLEGGHGLLGMPDQVLPDQLLEVDPPACQRGALLPQPEHAVVRDVLCALGCVCASPHLQDVPDGGLIGLHLDPAVVDGDALGEPDLPAQLPVHRHLRRHGLRDGELRGLQPDTVADMAVDDREGVSHVPGHHLHRVVHPEADVDRGPEPVCAVLADQRGFGDRCPALVIAEVDDVASAVHTEPSLADRADGLHLEGATLHRIDDRHRERQVGQFADLAAGDQGTLIENQGNGHRHTLLGKAARARGPPSRVARQSGLVRPVVGIVAQGPA
uniref:hypothetical protein n=1 Tax=Streptomyces justiciae TaxID=2780140 RepID=UPI0039088F98